jgi:hypothetical protein
MSPKEMDLLKSCHQKRLLGISDTAAAYSFPDWAREHPGRKVVIHRSFRHINESLAAIGFEPINKGLWDESLWAIRGDNVIHVSYHDIFLPGRKTVCQIWEHIFGCLNDFDRDRFDLLRKMHIQPEFSLVQWSPEVGRRLTKQVRGE